MLNRAPIFINGFGRGGTSLLLNLLLSHPEVCSPTGETHQVFKGDPVTDSSLQVLRKSVCYDLPILLTLRQDFFSPRLVRPRKKVPAWLQRFIDRILYREKLRARHDNHNRYRGPGVEYRPEEIAHARLVCKNVDGMIFTTDLFAEMYPDAVFIALVRNGLALCEGHLRRGRSAEEFAEWYRKLADKMLADAERVPSYFIVRFEDLLADPMAFVWRVYELARLDFGQVTHVRLQQKRTLTREGEHRLMAGSDRQVVWYGPDRFHEHLQRDVNENQIGRLGAADRQAFLSRAGGTMERLGYR